MEEINNWTKGKLSLLQAVLQCIEQRLGLIKSFCRIQGCCSFIRPLNKSVSCAFLAQHVSDEALGDRSGLSESTLSVNWNLSHTNRERCGCTWGVVSSSSEQPSTEERPKGHSAVLPSNALLSPQERLHVSPLLSQRPVCPPSLSHYNFDSYFT